MAKGRRFWGSEKGYSYPQSFPKGRQLGDTQRPSAGKCKTQVLVLVAVDSSIDISLDIFFSLI